ncbi:MAG TPA: hypothetical protein VFP59_14355 [Candidatus Angelobacter sp.]|nr:hypothetical protein [Candidatus Angelobacter sp.]
MPKLFSAVFAAVCLASSCVPQISFPWKREDKTDQLRGTSYAEFTLPGRFLTPPQKPQAALPFFIVDCEPGKPKRVNGGYTHGKLLNAYMLLSAVAERTGDHAVVQYRLDDGKMHTEDWGISKDHTAIYPSVIELNTVLYGHFMKHKEGTNPPVRKLVIAVDEHRGGQIVMQFDMPDPTAMADACGILIRKQK